jgi:dihydroneopterin aldolase
MAALTPELERALERSLQLASHRKHGYATLEHLLLSLLDDPSVTEVLTACRVDINKLRRAITDYLDNECGSFVMEDAQVHPTAAFQRVIQRAVLHVESSSQGKVNGANVLVSIFAERDSHAAWFLGEQNMTRYDAVKFISGGAAETELTDEELKAREEAIRRRLDEEWGSRRRERAARDTPPFYLIRISGVEVSASIGIHGFEQAARQKLLVSVTLMLAQPAPGNGFGDDIVEVKDYDFVRAGVLDLVAKRHFNLQETLCAAILDLCLSQKGLLGAVVQTDKPDVYPGVAGVACRMARLGSQLAGFPWWALEV